MATEDATTIAVENFRRMAFGDCSHCGEPYEKHDPSPQCPNIDCPHCHQSDFKAADDDVTLLGRDDLRLVWDYFHRVSTQGVK